MTLRDTCSRVVSAALLVGALGCSTTIVAEGAGGSPSSLPTAVAAIAKSNSPYLCGSPEPCAAGSLILMLGTPPPVCAEPDQPLPCGPTASDSVYIGLPPDLVREGTFALSNRAIAATFQAAQSSSDPNVCPLGSGSFTLGTLTITDLGASSVSFSLSGTSLFGLAGPNDSVDGRYVAPRCP